MLDTMNALGRFNSKLVRLKGKTQIRGKLLLEGFNSKLVRLKVGMPKSPKKPITTFQFQTGSIKS